MLTLEGPAWTFALDFYARPGIAPACLTLQDQADVDIVHLILVLYADTVLGRPLSGETIAALRGAMAPWRAATVLPLRAIRRGLKGAPTTFPAEQEDVRSRIKTVELLAEQVQIAFAERWLRDQSPADGLPLDAALQAVVASYNGHGVRDADGTRAALALIAETAERMRGS